MVVHLRWGLLLKTVGLLAGFLVLTVDVLRWIAKVLATKIFYATKDIWDHEPVTVAWIILFVELVLIFYIAILMYMRWDRKITAKEQSKTK